MINKTVINIGSIHDIPISQGIRFSIANHSFAIFRETYGHFYAFEDQRSDVSRGLHKGHIKDGKVCLPDGHSVDVHTGKIDHSDRFLHCMMPWVENGFIFLSISNLLLTGTL